MRKIIIGLGSILLFCYLAAYGLPLLTIFIARRQISSVCAGANVSIGRCTMNPFSFVRLQGLSVKKASLYAVEIGEVALRYDLWARRVKRVEVHDGSIQVSAPHQRLQTLLGSLRMVQGSGIPIDEIVFSSLNVSCDTKDLGVSARLGSLRYAFRSQSLAEAAAAVATLRYEGVRLNEGIFEYGTDHKDGAVRIRQVAFDKVTMSDIAGRVRLERDRILFDPLTFSVFGGTLDCRGSFSLNAPFSYEAALDGSAIDIETVVSDLNLTEKFQMTGRAQGTVAVSGSGVAIKALEGALSSLSPGGRLLIKDARFLENMARSSGSSLGVVVESFKDYHYASGTATLGFEKGSLITDVILDGESGRRRLSVTVHDFDLGDIAGYLKKR